ncbi:methyl-accepting chemotaxis protein [Arsukibacterium sp.]|uniref:methyl-accepting chemotaxis protein n=1 Tax=Arsukibacterium sp. TaxID=1977258 RepID=UPI002FD8DECC
MALREIKKTQIYQHFDSALANFNVIEHAAKQYGTQFEDDTTHRFFTTLNTELSFYDIFLIDPSGKIVYTVARESDYQTNLVSGPYRLSGLGMVYQRAMNTSEIQVVDFAPYAPSNNEPAAFMAKVFLVNNQRWVVAVQLSIDKINQVMRQRDGMGETGETYLVGPDYLMRSDSFLDPVNRSIVASFAGTIEKNGAQTHAVEQALQGVSGVGVVIDYNGNPVLSAYSPITVFGLNWALLAEIDEAEVNQPVIAFFYQSLILITLSIAFSFFASSYFKKMVMRPLGGEPEEMRKLMSVIASGDLSTEISAAHERSLKSQLANTQLKLGAMIKQIANYTNRLAATSEELSSVTLQSSHTLNQQNDELAQAVTAVTEMAATIEDVSKRTMDTARDTDAAEDYCKTGLQKAQAAIRDVTKVASQTQLSAEGIGQLAGSVTDITSVVEVIRAVAEQTNLLALNAAIEAARAGESGRGFAVVADEVRALAHRTQESTAKIEQMIETVKHQTGATVSAIRDSVQHAHNSIDVVQDVYNDLEVIVKLISNVNLQNSSISSAAKQQAVTAAEVDRSLVSIRDLAIQNASGATQTSESSNELANLASDLNKLTQGFTLKDEGMSKSD